MSSFKDNHLLLLDKNLLVEIAINLDLPDILRICRTSKRFDKYVCQSDIFWYKKLQQDYKFVPSEIKNSKDKYMLLRRREPYGISTGAKKGYLDLVKFFVDKNFGTKNYFSSFSDGFLQEAIKGGHRDIIDYIIGKVADLNWDSALRLASFVGRKDLIDLFISKGADDWDSALWAASENGNKDLVDFFINKGADDWNLALRGASAGGHLNLVLFFIEKGARTEEGLIAAADSGNVDVLQILIKEIEKRGRKLSKSDIRNLISFAKNVDTVKYLKSL